MEAFKSDDEFLHAKNKPVSRQYVERNREIVPRNTVKSALGTVTNYNFQNLYNQNSYLDSQLTIQKLYGMHFSKKGASAPKF